MFLLLLPVPTNVLFLRIPQLDFFYFHFYIYLRIYMGEKKCIVDGLLKTESRNA